MKNLKKIAALVIVLAMALSSVAFASFSDVSVDASYNEAVTVMSALGLLKGYEDGTFGPDKTITRAEFAAVVVRALGMEDAAAGAVTNTKFTDVTSSHWAAGYVQIANQQGIIAGYGDGKFGPDDEVTYEQAVKMIVCALGYAPKFATVADAYPTAYLAQANTSGITVGAVGKIGDKASRAIVARLVYNALDVPLMEQLTFGKDVEYGIPDKYETLLSNNLNVAKVEASVSSISFDKENGNELELNISAIDDVYYRLSGIEVNDATTIEYADTVEPIKGYTCIAYIDCNEDDDVLVALAPKAGKNKTLTITSTQAKDAGADVTDNADAYIDNNNNNIFDAGDTKVDTDDLNSFELTYFKTSSEVDSKATTVKLESDVKIYTNLNASETDEADFEDAYGTSAYKEITLIDNDNNNYYDYIYVTEYYAMVVGEITARTYKITSDGKTDGAQSFLFLDPEDEDETFDITDKDGKALKFEDIKVGNIVNVFTSEDANGKIYNEVIVTDGKITGTVSEVNSDGEYKIGDKYYTSTTSVSVGDSGEFFVDMYDVILKYALESSNRTFGLVYATYIDSNGLDNDAKIMIYTTEGKFVTYDFNKNIKVDSKSFKKENITDAVDDTDDSFTLTLADAIGDPEDEDYVEAVTVTVAPGDLVMYVANSSSAITEIYSPSYIATKTSNDYKVQAYTANNGYRASNKKLGSLFITDSSKLIANELANTADFNKEDISMTSASIFNEDETNYKFQAIYDTDKNIVVAVLYETYAKADKASDVMYVTSVGSTTDSEGSSATAIMGVVKEESVKIVVNADTYVEDAEGNEISADFSKGDVIQYNGTGEVAAIRVLLTAEQIVSYDNSLYGLNITDEDIEEDGFIYGGSVESISNNTITFADGTDVYVPTSTPTMLVRLNADADAISRVYTSKLAVDMAETEESNYGTNDDYVIVYKYDGNSYAAIIVDVLSDTKF